MTCSTGAKLILRSVPMNLYPLFGRDPRAESSPSAAVAEGVALRPSQGTSPINVESDQYQHLRKAAPIDRPLLRTTMWFARLPEDVRPHALLRRYARIVNVIAAAWGDAKCFRVYMESLFTDTRGNRRGFPPDVLSELVMLRRYYDSCAALK